MTNVHFAVVLQPAESWWFGRAVWLGLSQLVILLKNYRTSLNRSIGPGPSSNTVCAQAQAIGCNHNLWGKLLINTRAPAPWMVWIVGLAIPNPIWWFGVWIYNWYTRNKQGWIWIESRPTQDLGLIFPTHNHSKNKKRLEFDLYLA